MVAGLNDLKKTRGWGRLLWEMDGTCGVRNGWTTDYIGFPLPRLDLWQNLVKSSKVSSTTSQSIVVRTSTKPTSIQLHGGKEVVFMGEGDRYYLCHKPTTCAKYLETLRKSRGSNDKVVSTAIKKEDDIDPWEVARFQSVMRLSLVEQD